MSMICGNCNKTGILWIGPFSGLTHTDRPHCGGINCQQAEELAEEEEDASLFRCGCGEFGEANYFAYDEPRFVCGGRWCMP